MSGKIIRAANWEDGTHQKFLSINPSRDIVALYSIDASKPDNEPLDRTSFSSVFESIQCLDYSTSHLGLSAVGLLNGSTVVFDILNPSAPNLVLRAKHSRPCNDVAFNSGCLLAAGLDKVRSDTSLHIWDITRYIDSRSTQIIKPTYSYLPSEVVSSIRFLPQSPTNLIVGSYKFLREIDTRAPTAVFQCATRCVHGIVIDPFRPDYFASYGEDGSISLWDRRKLRGNSGAEPLLHITRLLGDVNRKTHNLSFRYSISRQGEFSVLCSGELIRQWTIGYAPEFKPSLEGSRNSFTSLDTESVNNYTTEVEPFVSSVEDIKTNLDKIISFDYLPDPHFPGKVNYVCMRQSGSTFKMGVTESQYAISFDPLNSVLLTGADGAFIETPRKLDVPQQNLTFSDDHEGKIASDDDAKEMMELSSEMDYGHTDSMLLASDILYNDICTKIRVRAIKGYSLNCELNLKIARQNDSASNEHLVNTWKWVELAYKSISNEIIRDEIDLGYEGVLGIWDMDVGLGHQNRYFKTNKITEKEYNKMVSKISDAFSWKPFCAGIKKGNSSSSGSREAQRRLCLISAGWTFGLNELDEKLKQIQDLGQYEKAAGWAVFHGDIPKAVDILANSNNERLKLMSAAVAGYLAYKDSPGNSPWKERCRAMANDLDDPYLRAVFAFIADNDWWDVLDESSLPLRERLGIALRFLPDKDLTVYLNLLAERVIDEGQLEGIILTGITPRGIDLLQAYVDRTGDVQTATLIASFGSPRYFHDPRVDHWTESYRDLLNSWKLFNQRARFDVGRSKLSKTWDGTMTVRKAPKQVHLQCSRCNKNIAMTRPKRMGKDLPSQRFKGQFLKTVTTTSCPHCGSPLPRCAVCLLSLGMELPTLDRMHKPRSNDVETQFRQGFGFCVKCNHGTHTGHAEEWFSKHSLCPVPDCNCSCNGL